MKEKILLISLPIFGIIIGYLLSQFFGFDIFDTKQKVSERVKNLYELANPGSTFSVESIKEESGIYKILLKAITPFGITYREAYVTKDGKFLTEGIIFVEESILQIEKMKNFVDCLDRKNLRIYGMSNHTATLLQLNLLGRYSAKLFVACDNELVERCITANVSEVPSVVIGNSVYPGVKTIDWFENATGCKF